MCNPNGGQKDCGNFNMKAGLWPCAHKYSTCNIMVYNTNDVYAISLANYNSWGVRRLIILRVKWATKHKNACSVGTGNSECDMNH